MTVAKIPNRFLNPAALPQPVGYTHVVETHGGRTIYISGQVALNANGDLVGLNDLEAQTTQVFRNLHAALASVGATFAQVVKLTYFLVDISQMHHVRNVRATFIADDHLPASSAVEVRRLFRDDVLIEIEAIAVVPE
jgi:reactive intermediate/imine deaminase